MSMPNGLLLAGVGARLRIAAIAVLCLWAAVLWASLSQPAPPRSDRPRAAASSLRLVVASGQPAPGGGSFDRFDQASQPIIAPVNASGQVAFYASLIRTRATEGLFVASGSRIIKMAAVGDPVPGGGRISEFAKHPIPSLNDAGKVAFGAAVAGARANEGVFLAAQGNIKVIALSGADAPGIPTGTFVEFDTPTLNNRDEVAFVATVRRGRETLQVLYLYSDGTLRKLVAAGDPAPRGGTFDKFGVPSMNNKGGIAFPAVVEHGAVLGGIFIAGTRDLHLLVGAGDLSPSGAMLVRFSERVSINDDDEVAFGAQLGTGAGTEAVFVAGAAGLTQIATVGDDAPGGGRFAAFGAWPSLGAMVTFIAAVDGGSGPLGIYTWRSGELRRVAMVGDRLANGRALAGFALNPVASAGANGGLSFATAGETDGDTGIYYFGPPPEAE